MILVRSSDAFKRPTIGRAFHWMDRPATLKQLDAMLEPDGAVILFSDSHPEAAGVFLAQFVQEGDRSLCCRRDRTREAPVTGVVENMRRSCSPHLSVKWNAFRSSNEDSRQLSALWIERCAFSITSRERLGVKADELTSEIRELMVGFALEGVVPEVVESNALIARRNSPP